MLTVRRQFDGPASVRSARRAVKRWVRDACLCGSLTILSGCGLAAACRAATPAGGSPLSSSPADGVDAPPVNTSPPTIAGIADAGHTLVATRGTWLDAAAIRDVWQRCDATANACTTTAVAGPYYTLSAADVGYTIVVRESARSATGAVAHVVSSPTPVVSVESTTTLVAFPSSAVANQTVTIVATVTTSVADAPPAGSVTFTSGGSALRGCSNEPVRATGQSVTLVCQASFPASTAGLAATFAPTADSYLLPSSSAVQSLVVNKDSTSTSLDVSATAYVGASTTYSAMVRPPASRPGPLTPTGSVDFFDGATPIASCSNRPLILGGATCTVSYAAPGTHMITARYSGDTNFSGSGSAAAPVTVANFSGSGSAAAPVTVARPLANTRPQANPLGSITAPMQWGFHYTPTYTTVTALLVNDALEATVVVQCAGRGCPFTKHTTFIAATRHHCGLRATRICLTHGTLDLTPAFRERRLAVGTKITVMITRPRWIGKYYSFTIRGAHGPRVRLACLPPGSVRPAAEC